MDGSANLVYLCITLVRRADGQINGLFREVERVVACQYMNGIVHGEEGGIRSGSERETRYYAREVRTIEHGVLVPYQSGVVAFFDGEDSLRQTRYRVVSHKVKRLQLRQRAIRLIGVCVFVACRHDKHQYTP